MPFDPGQIAPLLRQGGQYAAGAVSVLVLLGSMDAESAKSAVAAINDVVAGLSQATAGASKLMVVLGPAAGGLIAWWAAHRSSDKAKITDVKVMATDPALPAAPEAQEALKAATSSLPRTLVLGTAPGVATVDLAAKVASIPETGIVLATPEIAAATVSGKVVAPVVVSAKS